MSRRTNTFFIFLFFLVVSGFWVAPVILNPRDFLFHPNAQYSDVLISHWPNWQYIREALHTWNVFPLWNSLILSGTPLIGDPLFGIWYPPNWLSILLPVEMAINLLFLIHLIWAGVGMFYWMKSEGYHWGGAIVAGLAFCGMPKLIGHIGLGHLGLVSSVAWTPWLLLATRKLVVSLSSTNGGTLKWFASGGVVAGVLFIADPRWLFPAICLAIPYAIRTFHNEKTNERILLSKWILNISTGVVIFIGTISGLAVPMLEFIFHSTRTNLSVEEITELSLPLKDLIGALIPQYSAWPEAITFAGLTILGLAFVALLGKAKGRFFWSVIAVSSLILALGNQSPVFPFLLRLIPGLSLLRVPARFSFLGFISLSILAGAGMDIFMRNNMAFESKRWIRMGMVGFCGLLLLLGLGTLLILVKEDNIQVLSWLHMILGAIILFILAFYSLRKDHSKRMLIALWVIPIFLDLFLMNRSLLEIRSRENLFDDYLEIVDKFRFDPSQERIFSTSFSVPPYIGVMEGLQLADGVNPLQLNAYWKIMAQAVGFDPKEYSVTLPPFPNGDPSTPLYKNLDMATLGILNVRMIVSDYPLDLDSHLENAQMSGSYIYENPDFRPRAWIENGAEANLSQWRVIDEIDWSPNHIFIKAQGDGSLVLSEILFPGWVAYVDGVKTDIVPYKQILRSVSIPGGEHVIEFYYRPLSVLIGMILTFLSIIAVVIFWWHR
jgi:hypothetical protein